MTQSEGWLSRVARRFGAMMAGTPVPDTNGHLTTELPAEASTAPSSTTALPSDLDRVPSGISLSANGRYLYGGYSFSTLEQASDYATRMTKPVAALSSSRPPAAAPSSTKGPRALARWLGKPTTIEVGSRTVTLELVYYGTPALYDPARDKSRIDPTLPINPLGDLSGETLTYWQSYDRLDPRARWTYLDWLEGGRTDSNIPIGYVFVFFYGLEQRLLVDDAKDEAPAIFAELHRLLAIYAEDYSFANYASKLLALSCLYRESCDGPVTFAPPHNYESELPLNVRVRLGRRIERDEPFDADDCLLWVLSQPDVYLRTPGQRCFEELLDL